MRSVQLFLVLALLSVFTDSKSCSCKRFTVENTVDDASWIFTARITKLELSKEKDEFDGDLITVGFTDVESIKGNLELLTQLITNTSTCGVDYEISRNYLIMANQDGFTDICTGTMQIVVNEKHAFFKVFRIFIDELKAYLAGDVVSISEFYNPITRRTLNGPQKSVKSGCKHSGPQDE